MNAILQFGEWNPQAVREFKGRLKGRNITIAIAASIVTQALLMLVCISELPTLGSNSYSTYCIQNPEGYCSAIDWAKWWLSLFQFLCWLLPLGLVIGSVYLLIEDLSKEERRGTLNFIRLTPQSSQSILLGKILGVPILVYLAAALYLPLFAIAGINAGINLFWIVGYLLFLGVVSFFFSSAALLMAFLKAEQPWLGSFGAAYFVSGLLSSYFLFFEADQTSRNAAEFKWFILPLGQSYWLYQTFVLTTLGVGCYWIWQALNRRFRNPNATILSKAQSYGLVASVQLWVLGFIIPLSEQEVALAVVTSLNLLGFLVIISAITPHFQTCLDWARYRHTMPHRRSLWQDLVWGEKSPAIVAIAINLGIMLAIWGTWVLTWPNSAPKWQSLAVLIVSANLILVYSAIAQAMLMSKAPKRVIWTGLTLSTALALPPVLLYLLAGPLGTGTLTSAILTTLWFASTFSAPWFVVESISGISVGLAMLAQWSLFGLFTLQLSRKFQQAGASAAKTLTGTSPMTAQPKA
ncbi:MAG: hypothetical protein F6K32_04505 [Desertifilum sp. SIO1I2]|nr:hypothetical protein [Desertifilum sp. SIO1I2]